MAVLYTAVVYPVLLLTRVLVHCRRKIKRQRERHDGESDSNLLTPGLQYNVIRSLSLPLQRRGSQLKCVLRCKPQNTSMTRSLNSEKQSSFSFPPINAINSVLGGRFGTFLSSLFMALSGCLKKNLNVPRLSGHPPVRGKERQNV